MMMIMTMMTLITDMKVLMKNLDTWDIKRGGQSYTCHHIRPSARVTAGCQSPQRSQCCTRFIRDRTEENRACLLAASRVHHFVSCSDPSKVMMMMMMMMMKNIMMMVMMIMTDINGESCGVMRRSFVMVLFRDD